MDLNTKQLLLKNSISRMDENLNERVARTEQKLDSHIESNNRCLQRIESTLKDIHGDFTQILREMRKQQDIINEDQNKRLGAQDKRLSNIEMRIYGVMILVGSIIWLFDNGFLKMP